MTTQEREKLWTERLTAYKTSGQTKKAWCRNNNIDVKSFYRWGSRLGNKEVENRQGEYRFILAKERICDESAGSGNIKHIGITLGKATINVNKGFDAETLRNVLQIASSIC